MNKGSRKPTHSRNLLSLLLVLPAFLVAAPVQFGAGNHYELITVAADWTSARDAAANATFNGVNGHLATITSQAENDFIAGALGAFNRAWIGGSDATAEGDWEWVVGPEAGDLFWIGGNSGMPPPGGAYNNWNRPGEPNNAGGSEHYTELLGGGGWNDQSASDVLQYIVEYEVAPIPLPTALVLFIAPLVTLVAKHRRL